MNTIAVVGQGDMGSAVSKVLAANGMRVLTDLSGRSEHSKQLAVAAGSEDVGSLEGLLEAADLLLSILPPAAAEGFAGRVLQAMPRVADKPVFADCNAVAPATMRRIAERFAGAGIVCLDVGIVGPPPRARRRLPTRFYIAGPARAEILAWQIPELCLIDMGPELGRASAIKMTYAALNKATDALHTAVLMAAETLGVRAELMDELAASQVEAARRMHARIPYLAATSERYVGEMREIAATFNAAGVTPRFHEGAEWLFAQLAETPLAAETRASLPSERKLEEALAVFCAGLKA